MAAPWEQYAAPAPWTAYGGAAQAAPAPSPPKPAAKAPEQVLKPWDQFKADVGSRFTEAKQDFKRDLTRFGMDPKDKANLGTTGNVMKTGLDAAGMAFSPAMAVGDQLNRIAAPKGIDTPIGHVSPQQMTDAESLAGGAAGLVGGAREINRMRQIAAHTRAAKTAAQGAASAFQAGTTATREVTNSVKKLMAPATVSRTAEDAAGVIRSARGRNQLQADQSANTLVRAQRAAGKQSPEWHQQLMGYIEGRSKTPKPPDAAEYRKPDTSTPLGRLRAKSMEMRFSDTDTKRAADVLRDTYRHYRTRAEYIIARNVGAAPKFIEDYFTHIWKEDPERVKTALGGFSRQGSGRNFRARELPTIEDGLKAGLTLKYPNAFEATTHYVQNMSRFLTTHDIQEALKGAGHASWHIPGSQPEGWVPLNGILTERIPRGGGRKGGAGINTPKPQLALPAPDAKRLGGPGAGPEQLRGPAAPLYEEPGQLGGRNLVRTGHPAEAYQIGGEARKQIGEGEKLNVTPKPEEPVKPPTSADKRPLKQVLYAHPDAARVYNNFISKGLEGTTIGPFAQALRRTENAMVMAKLGLSAFHATVMAKEGMVSELARSFTELSRGKPALAAKIAARVPVAPILQYRKGSKFAKALLDAGNPHELADPVQRAFAKSGQMLHMDDFYRTRGAGSFFQSFRRGTFAEDMKTSLQRIFHKDSPAWERIKGTVDLAANAIQTASAPLFEHIIPHLKQGAFASEMEGWVAANPNHTEAELVRQARKVGDSIDNRFGELTQDNLFWHRWMKQTAQMVLTSFSWDLGTVREIAGGIKDIPESARNVAAGKGITPRTAYVAALATFVPIQNAIFQYLKTGKPPGGAMDVIAPQTGGTTPRGNPERAAIPGYEKDVYGFSPLNPGGVGSEVTNKLSPLAQVAKDYGSGTDYRGLPIMKPGDVPDDTGMSWQEQLAGDIADRLTPISLGNKAKVGSNIGPVERGLGVRPSLAYLEDRDYVLNAKRKRDTRAWMTKTRAAQREQAEEQP